MISFVLIFMHSKFAGVPPLTTYFLLLIVYFTDSFITTTFHSFSFSNNFSTAAYI